MLYELLRDCLRIQSLKILTLASICLAQGFCDSFPISGLIGGYQSGALFSDNLQYAATVSPLVVGTVNRLSLGQGIIQSIALNKSGLGLVGGKDENNKAYAAFVSSDNGVQKVPLNTSAVNFTGVDIAINDAGLGLIGAGLLSGAAYAAFITPNSVTPISFNLLPNGNFIHSVDLANTNLGLVGGATTFDTNAYVALVFPSGASQEISLGLTGPSRIVAVALNDSEIGLIAGDVTPDPYAAYVVNGSALPIAIADNIQSRLNTCAINESSVGLIGGTDGFAAFVYPHQAYQVVSGIPKTTVTREVEIFASAINTSGYGLIGGALEDNGGEFAYAALISPNGIAQFLQGLPTTEDFLINSVALNDFNQGLIGGLDISVDSGIPYAAIVSPSGIVTSLNLGFLGAIQAVAINAFFLSQMPTQGLTGNNLRFANYINSNAAQNVFYFVPALLEGSLAIALESAAPTRNAISFYTALQNAFYFTTALSTHLRDQHYIHSRAALNRSNRSTAQLETSEETEEDLLASRCFPDSKTGESKCWKKAAKQECPKPAPFTLWLEAIGALAYFDSQSQTPGFNPSTGGANLGCDAKVTDNLTVGGGATYLYTHIHEKDDAGRAHINQEDLFLYASWEPKHFYLDLGLWGGLFQTHQNRHIQMSGFSFHALSKPKGWQLTPHLELGWIGNIVCSQTKEISWNLLGMLDWAHAWQRKYKEHGSGPFNVQQNSHHGSLLRTEAGVRFSETLFYSTWNLIFQEKGSYVNVQAFNPGTVKGFIVGSPGSFTLETLNKAQNLGVVQFLMSAASFQKRRPTGTLFYQGEFGSRYQSHQIGLEFAMSF